MWPDYEEHPTWLSCSGEGVRGLLGKCRYDEDAGALVLTRADGTEAPLQPAFVRRNDTSAASINEWTGERLGLAGDLDNAVPAAIQPIGNYAALIMWQDGFNQVGLPLRFVSSEGSEARPLVGGGHFACRISVAAGWMTGYMIGLTGIRFCH